VYESAAWCTSCRLCRKNQGAVGKATVEVTAEFLSWARSQKPPDDGCGLLYISRMHMTGDEKSKNEAILGASRKVDERKMTAVVIPGDGAFYEQKGTKDVGFDDLSDDLAKRMDGNDGFHFSDPVKIKLLNHYMVKHGKQTKCHFLM